MPAIRCFDVRMVVTTTRPAAMVTNTVQFVLVYPVVYNVVPIIEMDFESNAVCTLCVL